jgi:Ala-tRNA(Pro) deacylase
MPLARLKKLLDSQNVKYVAISHSPAYTAQEIAASAHIAGGELAKTVMVKIDGEMAMAVLPAPLRVDLECLQDESGAQQVELAGEEEFERLLPGCELGAMPPFGNLFNMQVFADRSLSDHAEIAFNAGSHIELVRMGYSDFERLVRPKLTKFAVGVTTESE